jgi:hypothetical protein
LKQLCPFFYLIIYVFCSVIFGTYPTQHNWFWWIKSPTSQIFSYNLNDSVAIVIGRCFLAVISAAGVVDVGNFTVDHMPQNH